MASAGARRLNIAVHMAAEIQPGGEGPMRIRVAQDGTFHAQGDGIGAVLGVQRRGDEQHAVHVRGAAVNVQGTLAGLPVNLAG